MAGLRLRRKGGKTRTTPADLERAEAALSHAADLLSEQERKREQQKPLDEEFDRLARRNSIGALFLDIASDRGRDR